MRQSNNLKQNVPPRAPSAWTFLTNHARVLLQIAQDPSLRMKDAATTIGITERAVQRIIKDLLDDGYIQARKDGRRNTYSVQQRRPLRHPADAQYQLRDLIKILTDKPVNEKPTNKARK